MPMHTVRAMAPGLCSGTCPFCGCTQCCQCGCSNTILDWELLQQIPILVAILEFRRHSLPHRLPPLTIGRPKRNNARHLMSRGFFRRLSTRLHTSLDLGGHARWDVNATPPQPRRSPWPMSARKDVCSNPSRQMNSPPQPRRGS